VRPFPSRRSQNGEAHQLEASELTLEEVNFCVCEQASERISSCCLIHVLGDWSVGGLVVDGGLSGACGHLRLADGHAVNGGLRATSVLSKPRPNGDLLGAQGESFVAASLRPHQCLSREKGRNSGILHIVERYDRATEVL
jgi:hypothetical protein